MHTVENFEPSFININQNKYIKYSFNLSNVSRIKVSVDDNGVFSVYARSFNGKPLPRKLLCFEFDLPKYLIEHHLLHMINTMHSYGVFTIWYPVFTESLLKYSRPIPENKPEDKKDDGKAENSSLETKAEENPTQEQHSTPIKREVENSSPASNVSKKSTSTLSTTPSRKPLENTEGSSSSNVSDISVESH